jgi:hypothetical protein
MMGWESSKLACLGMHSDCREGDRTMGSLLSNSKARSEPICSSEYGSIGPYLTMFLLDAGRLSTCSSPTRRFVKGLTPTVWGTLCPPEIPPAPTVEAAKADLPRAALGTMLHLGDPDGAEVAYRTLRAAYEVYGLDMLAWMYNLIRGIVGEERFTEIERLIMLDAQTHFIPKTAFEREHFSKGKSEGKSEGKAEGMAMAILAVLAARGLEVTEDQRSKFLACSDAAKLDRLVARSVSAATTSELLADL